MDLWQDWTRTHTCCFLARLPTSSPIHLANGELALPSGCTRTRPSAFTDRTTALASMLVAF